MDPSSTPAEVKQQKYQTGSRHFKPLEIDHGLRKYIYEASRISLESISIPKAVTTVRIGDAEAHLFETMPTLAAQQIWDTAFEKFQGLRNNILIEQLRLYGVRNIRSLLLTAYLDHNRETLASTLLGDVERWAFYEIYKADADLLERLAAAKTTKVAHPSCLYDTHELAQQHGKLLNTYSFRPAQKTRGPKTYVGLLYRYALHTCFGSTNFKPLGRLYYPAPDQWHADPFVQAFPNECNPDKGKEHDAHFESMLRDVPKDAHEQARAQWYAPTWERLVLECELCLRFHRPKWKESFVDGVGIILLHSDNFPLDPLPVPAAFRPRRQRVQAKTAPAAREPLVVPRPDAAEGPEGLALACSPSDPGQSLDPSALTPETPAQDAEAALRVIFDALESNQGVL